MKTLKMLQAMFLVTILALLAGCSDQITSSGEAASPEKVKETAALTTLPPGLPVVPTFRAEVRLKPFRSYTFDVMTTGFDRLYSIDINNVTVDPNDDKNVSECEGIFVYNKKEGLQLDCHSKGFELSEITVENTSSKFLDLVVSIRGIKQKKGIKLEK